MTTTYGVGNQCDGLGKAHTCGGIKPMLLAKLELLTLPVLVGYMLFNH